MLAHVQLRRCHDVEEFLGRSETFLVRHEARHALLLGICADLRRRPDPAGYLAVVEGSDGAVVAAALRTPPRNLVLSLFHDEVPAVAELVAADADQPPGVVGPPDESRAVAAAWSRRSGRQVRHTLSLGLFAADAGTLAPPPRASGGLRQAGAPDRDLLATWAAAFARDAFGHEAPGGAEALIDGALQPGWGGLVLWEDGGRPVSLAGFTGRTPNGIRVVQVYTPPAERRRGYATALVAELTRRLLSGGRRFVFLTTDLANPTSNQIYRRIGYRKAGEAAEWRFD